MKVERIQLPPSSTYSSLDSKDSGQRVNSTGDSTQHRRNGQQMRKDAPEDDRASKDETHTEVQAAAEPASKPDGSQHLLNITA